MGVHSNGSVYVGSTIDIWEKFTKSNYSDGRISLRSHHNTYLWVDQEGMVHGDATDLGDWGKFTQIPTTNGTYLFKSHHNTYLGVRASGLVYANNLLESGKKFMIYMSNLHYNVAGSDLTTSMGNFTALPAAQITGGNDWNSSNTPVSNTNDDALYQTMRYGNMQFNIPVSDGTYIVKLHFSDSYHSAAGKRVFNVDIEGNRELSNFDVIAEAGRNHVALVKTFRVEVSDKNLDLDFINVTDNAIINAIEITPAPKTVRTNYNVAGPDMTTLMGNFTALPAARVTGGNDWNSSNTPVSNTNDDALYQTMRYGNMQFNIPVSDGTYMVKLHFSDSYHSAAGKRVFNVDIEGNRELSNFDVIAETGRNYVALVKTFRVDVSDKNLDLDFNNVTDTAIISAIEIIPISNIVRINVAGSDMTTLLGDDFTSLPAAQITGGNDWNFSNTPVSNTNDDALYQTMRYGNMQFNIPVSDGTYMVRLHFSDSYHSAAGKRVFNVDIEGNRELSNFDVIAEAGRNHVALIKTFTVQVSEKNLNLDFINVTDNAIISAIEIIPVSNLEGNL